MCNCCSFSLVLGVTDAKGRVGQLKGTGLVLEAVNVPLSSSPSRIVLQQLGGAGEQDVRFVYKSGVVEVLKALHDLFVSAQSPSSLRHTTSLLSWNILLH
jgi:hypothetical protein